MLYLSFQYIQVLSGVEVFAVALYPKCWTTAINRNKWISGNSWTHTKVRGHLSHTGKLTAWLKEQLNNIQVQVLSLKLDCVFWTSLMLTSLKGIHCYSTLICFTRIKGFFVSTCTMVMALVMRTPKETGWHEHYRRSLTTCAHKSQKQTKH